MLLSLAACAGGGGGQKAALIGTWKAVDTETETEYGLGIEFLKDGKMRYGLTEDIFAGIAEGKEGDEIMAGLDMLMTIKYKIISDTEMEITASTLFGLAKESAVVEYRLEGDTLMFDGATYTRVK